MKRSFKSVLGVTLLEIMLVLAIAAMIVVMSIRYYQSASLNQKVASAMDNITGIVAAGESVYNSTNTLASASSAITAYLPGNKLPASPWGGTFAIQSPGPTSFNINVPGATAAACAQLTNLSSQNAKLTGASCTNGFTVTFDVTK